MPPVKASSSSQTSVNLHVWPDLVLLQRSLPLLLQIVQLQHGCLQVSLLGLLYGHQLLLLRLRLSQRPLLLQVELLKLQPLGRLFLQKPGMVQTVMSNVCKEIRGSSELAACGDIKWELQSLKQCGLVFSENLYVCGGTDLNPTSWRLELNIICCRSHIRYRQTLNRLCYIYRGPHWTINCVPFPDCWFVVCEASFLLTTWSITVSVCGTYEISLVPAGTLCCSLTGDNLLLLLHESLLLKVLFSQKLTAPLSQRVFEDELERDFWLVITVEFCFTASYKTSCLLSIAYDKIIQFIRTWLQKPQE